MKLLVSELEFWRRYVSREFYYVMSDLIAKHGWRHVETYELWNDRGTLKDRLLARFGELLEAILFWESFKFLAAHAREIYCLDCPKFCFADDLHCRNEPRARMKVVSFALCDTVLSAYAYAWNDFYPEFCGTKTVVWIPHSAAPDFLLRYNPRPENSILLSGAVTHSYPLRSQVKELHSRQAYSITHHAQPGYQREYDYARDGDVGSGYAELINQHRVGFTDSLVYKYMVAKYFEIPATGALLLADGAVSRRLRELGFVENEHYLPVSAENLEERIRYVPNERNHAAVDEVRRKGQALVWARHKTGDRARQINEICAG